MFDSLDHDEDFAERRQLPPSRRPQCFRSLREDGAEERIITITAKKCVLRGEVLQFKVLPDGTLEQVLTGVA